MFCVKHFFTPSLSPPKNWVPHGGVENKMFSYFFRVMMLSSRDHQLLIGAQAFDDLTMALETPGDVKGMTWVKGQTDLLKSTKRYFKSEYKVMVCASVLSIVLYRI